MGCMVGMYYAFVKSEPLRVDSMPVNWVTYTSYGRERDMLSILMDSNLYFELSLQERRVLLNHIVESYRSPSLSRDAGSVRIEKRADRPSSAESLGL